jgi:hypothetical protein
MAINLEAEVARAENNAVLIAALEDTGLSEVESGWELDVLNDAEHGRWFATLGAEAIAELPYRFVGGRVVLLTTRVGPASRNDRVATEPVSRVLDEIRESGTKITVIRPVGGEFIARNPEYATSSIRSIPVPARTPNPWEARTTSRSPRSNATSADR